MINQLQKFESLKIKGYLAKENIKIYLPRKSSMTYSNADYTREKYYISPIQDWEKPVNYENLYDEEKLLKAFEIKENPGAYILQLSFYNLNELIDIQPPRGSYFFNLKTEPFDEEGELEEKVLLNWINKFDLEYKKDYYHASGHAPGFKILEMVEKINPKLLFPVHTEGPEFFDLNNAINHIERGKSYEF